LYFRVKENKFHKQVISFAVMIVGDTVGEMS